MVEVDVNILPTSIAKRMKQGETMIVEHFDSVTVLFCDIVGFTQLAADISPNALVDKLNKIFLYIRAFFIILRCKYV